MYKILIFLMVLCPVFCFAGSVTDAPGTPVDSLELLDLGINPDLFLFTGNTMYDYNGTYELEIIGIEADPSTVTSLAGLTIQQVLVILGDSGNSSDVTGDGSADADETTESPSTPEPVTSALCLAGALTFLIYQSRGQFKKSGNG